MAPPCIIPSMPPILPFIIAAGVGGVLLLMSKDAQAAFASPGTATRREIELSRKAGVPVAVMRAIGQKESTDSPPPAGGWPPGRGAGRLHMWGGPKVMRFEPHVFNRRHPSQPMPSSRGDKPSRTESEVREAAFNEAFSRNPRAAVESTSWGRYQVMGYHFLRPMYGNNAQRFLDSWIQSDWENVENLSDELFVYWWKANPSARSYANKPMEALVTGSRGITTVPRGYIREGQPLRAVDMVARRYNGSYNYAIDRGGSPGLLSAYRQQVSRGAPTSIV